MAWSHPYLSLLTSAVTIYKEAKSNDAKAKILAATISDIMAKAQEDSQGLCMPVFVLHIHLTGAIVKET